MVRLRWGYPSRKLVIINHFLLVETVGLNGVRAPCSPVQTLTRLISLPEDGASVEQDSRS